MNMDKWNEICFLLSENIQKDISEDTFEKHVIHALGVLGWKQFHNDFTVRPSIQIGSSKRTIPDIVINSTKGNNLFVIELKQPNLPLSIDFQEQLFSYMRLLKTDYGILIGQAVQIFYDGTKKNQHKPILLETINFNKDNRRGENFIKYFSKEDFSNEKLEIYADELIEKINRKEEYRILMNSILSNEFNDKLLELIKTDFLSEYAGEVIDSVLKNINVNITEKKPETTRKKFFEPDKVTSNKPGGVIKSIINIVSEEPKTFDEILAELIILFPDRQSSSMMNTIKAQLGGKNPLRIEREKNISIRIIVEDDNTKKYYLNESEHSDSNNNQIIKSHILKTYESVEEFMRVLAENYITDNHQKEVFLKDGVWLKTKLNYIGAMLLSSRGKEIFTPKDIRNIIRTEIIPSLSEISDGRLSGMILTSDVHKDSEWHRGYPCLQQIERGKYKFIGFV